MERTVFNKAQMFLLELFSHIKTDEELSELKQVICDYYAKKVQEEVDRLWDAGILSEEKLEEISKEHLRTPYKTADE